MTNTILTPVTLWENFDATLPLKETKISSSTLGSAVYNYVYFSGRSVNSNRVRIFGIYAEQTSGKADTIIILPDVSDTVDYNLVNHFVTLGYNVLSVDLRGKNSESENFTIFPNEISYANYENCENTFYKVEKTAKETCWYEWCAVARYAVSYAKFKSPSSKIGVLGIKHGANVGWMLSATDSNVCCSAFTFGAGWLAYNGVYKHSGEDIELNDERYRFLAGIEAHTYAQHVKIPVLYIGTTASDVFDSERAVDTLYRLNNDGKFWLNIATYSKDLLDANSLKDVELFFAKFIQNKKIAFPSDIVIESNIEDENIVYTVSGLNPQDVERVLVFSSNNVIKPSERLWHISSRYEMNGKDYVFKRRLCGKIDFDVCFAVVKFKNGLSLSSTYFYKAFNVETPAKTPLIFSSDNSRTCFFVDAFDKRIMGGVFTVEKIMNYVNGPCDIKGLSTENEILTYAVKEFAERISTNSFMKFDAFTTVPDKLSVSIQTSNAQKFTQTVSLSGKDCWQNITLKLNEFKADNGMPLKKFEEITILSLKSLGSVAINNLLIL